MVDFLSANAPLDYGIDQGCVMIDAGPTLCSIAEAQISA